MKPSELLLGVRGKSDKREKSVLVACQEVSSVEAEKEEAKVS